MESGTHRVQKNKAPSYKNVINKSYVQLGKIEKGKEVYNLLCEYENHDTLIKIFWEDKLKSNQVLWTRVYELRLCYTKEQKLVSFNYKILNNILAVPVLLHRWKIYDNPYCQMCSHVGTIEHVLLKCSFFKEYYDELSSICCMLGFQNSPFNLQTLVIGYKYYAFSYNYINEALNVVFYTAYKCTIMFRNGKRKLNPLRILYSDLKYRVMTKTYQNNHFMKALVNELTTKYSFNSNCLA